MWKENGIMMEGAMDWELKTEQEHFHATWTSMLSEKDAGHGVKGQDLYPSFSVYKRKTGGKSLSTLRLFI